MKLMLRHSDLWWDLICAGLSDFIGQSSMSSIYLHSGLYRPGTHTSAPLQWGGGCLWSQRRGPMWYWESKLPYLGLLFFWFRVPKVQLHFSHEKVILHQEYLTCGWDILALVGNDKYPLGEEPSCFGPRKKNHKAHCQATGNLFCNIAGGPWSKSKKVLWSTNGNFTNH